VVDLIGPANVAMLGVDRDAVRLDGGFGEQGLRRDVAPGEIHVVEGDGRAALGQLEADRASQPRRPAGHDGDASGEAFTRDLRIGPLLRHGRPRRGRLLSAMDQGCCASGVEPAGQFEPLQVEA
jgi:hypothetical protein